MNSKRNPEQEKIVKDELQSGRFRNIEEVIAEALQVLRERERLQSATKPHGQREAVREMLAFVERNHTRLDGVSGKQLIEEGHAQERMRVFSAGPVITDRVSTRIAKLQVAAHFPAASTASVPFLCHVHPRVQLFSHSNRAKFKRKPKCDITIAQFPAPPGAAAANPRSPLRRPRDQDRQSRPAVLSSLITGRSPSPESIASET